MKKGQIGYHYVKYLHGKWHVMEVGEIIDNSVFSTSSYDDALDKKCDLNGEERPLHMSYTTWNGTFL